MQVQRGEEELIASLGTPKEAAHGCPSNLLDKKLMKHLLKRMTVNCYTLPHLPLLAAPIGIPVGIAIILTIIGLFIAAASVILAFFTVSVTGILLGGLFYRREL